MLSTGFLSQIRQHGADIIKDHGERQFLLPTFALAVSPEVKAQAGNVCLSKTGCEPSEESALFPGDAATVHQERRALCWCLGAFEGACQVQAVKGPHRHAVSRHGASVVMWVGCRQGLATV